LLFFFLTHTLRLPYFQLSGDVSIVFEHHAQLRSWAARLGCFRAAARIRSECAALVRGAVHHARNARGQVPVEVVAIALLDVALEGRAVKWSWLSLIT